jgi:hypothetical protein
MPPEIRFVGPTGVEVYVVWRMDGLGLFVGSVVAWRLAKPTPQTPPENKFEESPPLVSKNSETLSPASSGGVAIVGSGIGD